MSVLKQLASSLDQQDEGPNVELANRIVAEKDTAAIKELVEGLENKAKHIQNDCIKVLYEIGSQEASLIDAYLDKFLKALDSKNNRLQWGAMTAIDTITLSKAKEVYQALPKVIDAANAGSVITKDHAVGILVKLSEVQAYGDNVFPLLMELLAGAPENQFPMYAENILPLINSKNKAGYIRILKQNLSAIEKESRRKRVEKILKKVDR